MNALSPTSSTLDHSKILSKQHSDGGWGLVPIQSRAGRFSSYKVSDFEAVNGFEAEWKYTPVRSLVALLDGQLDGGRYEYAAETDEGMGVEWVSRADTRIGNAGTPEERGSANAWTAFEQALAVTVNTTTHGQATITRSSFGTEPRAAHTLIHALPNTNGSVVFQNSGAAQLSENLEIVLDDGANLTVVSVQDFDDDAHHLATHFMSLGRDSHLKHVVVSLSGAIVRVNTIAHLQGAGADVDLLGVYFADAGQHLEHQVFVNHDAANTRSRVSYRGALQGEGARTVWIGDVLITPNAPGTDSYEENRNLLLTEGTRADSVPNLEIETGDIAGAGHASASGRFDDEQLFYLQARGIHETEARRLVVRGFLSALIQRIGIPALQQQLEDAIEAELLAGIDQVLEAQA